MPFFELFADPGMVEAVLGEKFPANLVRYIEEPLLEITEDELAGLGKSFEIYVRFCREVDYDYVFMLTGLSLQRSMKTTADTAAVQNFPSGQRHWQDEVSGPIQNWADFESYPWPKAEALSHAPLEYVSAILPEGMKIAAFGFSGIFENASWLMGLQPFSYALQDQPDLVEAICQRVGDLAAATCEQVVAIDKVDMVYLSDDLGFYSGTLVSPDVIRRYILPHCKEFVDVAHKAGKLVVFHSCGNMYKLMDECIDYVGIDGKHSFEDKILPVEEVYRRWGDRTAIMGGVGHGRTGSGHRGRSTRPHAPDPGGLRSQRHRLLPRQRKLSRQLHSGPELPRNAGRGASLEQGALRGSIREERPALLRPACQRAGRFRTSEVKIPLRGSLSSRERPACVSQTGP